jgi:hypothetical protein
MNAVLVYYYCSEIFELRKFCYMQHCCSLAQSYISRQLGINKYSKILISNVKCQSRTRLLLLYRYTPDSETEQFLKESLTRTQTFEVGVNFVIYHALSFVQLRSNKHVQNLVVLKQV